MAKRGRNNLTRIAEALEGLLAAYRADLAFRGVNLDLSAEGEGEILTTDDEEVSARIERIKQLGVGRLDPGFYIGEEPEGILTPEGEPRGEEVRIGYDPLFGPGWGLNVGPEGAEESGSGPHSLGSSSAPASGDVLGQGNSKKS